MGLLIPGSWVQVPRWALFCLLSGKAALGWVRVELWGEEEGARGAEWRSGSVLGP